MTLLGSLVSWLLKQMLMAWAWLGLVIGIGLRQKTCYSILMSFPCSRCKITRALSPLIGRAPVLWTMSWFLLGSRAFLLVSLMKLLATTRACYLRSEAFFPKVDVSLVWNETVYSCPRHGGDSPSERLGSLTRMSSKAMMRSTLSWNGTGSMPQTWANVFWIWFFICGRRVACLRFFQLLTFGFVVFDMVLSGKDLFGSFLAG